MEVNPQGVTDKMQNFSLFCLILICSGAVAHPAKYTTDIGLVDCKGTPPIISYHVSASHG